MNFREPTTLEGAPVDCVSRLLSMGFAWGFCFLIPIPVPAVGTSAACLPDMSPWVQGAAA